VEQNEAEDKQMDKKSLIYWSKKALAILVLIVSLYVVLSILLGYKTAIDLTFYLILFIFFIWLGMRAVIVLFAK
jgi:hypothetical protein